MNKLFFLIFILLAGTLYTSFAQENNYRIKHITVDQGMTQNNISCILQDSKGFMWFGTLDGLNRYDGYNIVSFRPDTTDHSLISGNIHAIEEDKDGNLWIGTRAGLSKFLYDQETFISFYHDPENENSIPENWINAMIIDDEDHLWVGTLEGLVSKITLDSTMTHIQDIQTFETGQVRGTKNAINAILQASDGKVWIGSTCGLFKINPATGLISRITDPENHLEPPASGIHDLYEDEKNRIWTGREIGVSAYSLDGDLLQTYNTKNSSLTHNVAYAVNKFPHTDSLLVGTLDGLFIFDEEAGIFHKMPVGKESFALNNQFISCIHNNSDGNIWIGTEKGGVNQFKQSPRQFRSFQVSKSDSNTISHNTVNSVWSDNHSLWIGTASGGLNRYDKQTGRFNFLTDQDEYSHFVSHNYISVLQTNHKYGVWAGTWGGGLNHVRYNTHTGKMSVTRFIPDPNIPHSIKNYFISDLEYDHHGNLWIAGSLGIEVYDSETGRFYQLRTRIGDEVIDGASSLMIDDSERLWIGTINGLFMAPLPRSHIIHDLCQPDSIYKYTHDQTNTHTISGMHITAMHQDKSGDLWFAVLGNGIERLDSLSPDLTTPYFSNFSTRNGLSNNLIYGILEDNAHHLWLSTDYGLTRFNFKSLHATTYFKSNGLPGNQFYWSAAHKCKDDTLYFGTTNGLVYFDPQEIKDNEIMPEVVITDFKLFNQTIKPNSSNNSPLNKTISKAETIKLDHDQNMISFEFAALNYSAPENNQYAYLLEGVDKDWVYTDSNRRFAVYANLDPGEYFFKVKASNNSGLWNQEGKSLKIIIIPPWWQTLIFRIFMGLIILSLIGLAIYRIVQRVIHSASQSILHERNQLKTLINNIPDMIFIKDKKLRFQVINNLTIDYMNGKSEKDFLNKTDFDFYPEHQARYFQQQELELLRTGKSLLNQEDEVFVNNQKKVLSTTKCPIINTKGETIGLVGVVRDITERKLIEQEIIKQSNELKATNEQLTQRQEKIEKQAEELVLKTNNLKKANELLQRKQDVIKKQTKKLEETNKKLTLINATKDRFFSIIAHDLRNPFNTLIGFSQLLIQSYNNLKENEVKEYLQLINNSSNKGYELLENLLLWSRSQTGHLAFNPQPLSLNTVIQKITGLLNGEARQKEINLKIAVKQDILLFADENMLQTILRNLISNSIKFTNPKGEISIHAHQHFQKGLITVEDNGIGIPEAEREKLFRDDQIVSTNGTSQEKGTGLGLLICKEFVEKQGGEINVKSMEGKGSKFIFSIPLAREEKN